MHVLVEFGRFNSSPRNNGKDSRRHCRETWILAGGTACGTESSTRPPEGSKFYQMAPRSLNALRISADRLLKGDDCSTLPYRATASSFPSASS
nr:hypothetical protein CFP56_41471 [Quercus suber]